MTSKKLGFPVQIRTIERLKNSRNGNPRFEIILDDRLSWAAVLKTASDHSFAYEIENPGFRVGDWVTISTTRAGRIDSMEKAQAPDYFIQAERERAIKAYEEMKNSH